MAVPFLNNGTGFVSWQIIINNELIAMKSNINKRTQVSVRTGEVWKIRVGVFHPTLLFTYDIPSEALYMKYKIVLN